MNKMNSNQKTARIAGLLYFIYIATSIVADLFGSIVNADPLTTVNRITLHETQFRIGFVISLFSVAFFLLAAWYLYVLLKPVNKDAALLFLLLNLSGFTIWCLSLLNLYAGLLLLSGAEYSQAFQPEQLQAQAMVFITLRRGAAVIAQIPYGIWLFPLGYLVYKSGFLPKILGILLIVDCFGLLIYVCQRFLLPGYDVITYPCLMVSLIAELSLTLWLLLKGVNDQGPTLAAGQN
ncbi:MAG: DUF4386 domain-containing protein [Anaerolineae bacterium]|nr:DUF4386 domain-containing protein [Anaerolineae bacterium]